MGSEAEPKHEFRWKAGLRDIVGGLLLLGVGAATGGSALGESPDAADYVFDIAGLLWVAWGLVRVVFRRS